MKKKRINKSVWDSNTKDDLKLPKPINSIPCKETVLDDSGNFRNREEKIKLLAHAVSSINECVCITDANNILIFVNDAFIRTYGYSREELIGHSIDMVRGSNIECDYAEKIRTSTIQTGWVGELVNKKKDGTEFPISLSTAVVHDDKGIPIALIGIASDITGKKNSEEQLRHSEESYRGLFNTITDAIYIQDKNGLFLDVNLGVEKMYGYKREEIIGRTPEFLSAPGKNDFAKIVEFIKDTFEKGKQNSFEFWGLKKNGEIFPKTVTIQKGNYFGQSVVIAIARDITEQRQRELILQESEERYRSIFHNSNAVMLVIDPLTMKIFDANNSACEYYGYTKEEITSLKKTDINIAPPPAISEGLATAAAKTNNYFVSKHKLSNGIIRDVEVYSSPIEFNGKKFLHSIVHDITEKRQIELALQSERELFIGGPVVTIQWHANLLGGIKYVSPNVSMVLGYKPEELLDDKFNYNDIIHPDDLNRILWEMEQYIKTQQDVYEQEYRIKKKDGKHIWIHDFTKAARDVNNNIIDLHGYIIDITSRKEAEEFLLRSEQELRKTNKMKDKFFSILSHDLRSPFQGLIGMATILLEDEELTREERIEFTQKLYEGLKTQFNFMDGLLTWNRVQRGAIEFSPTINDLSRLITETITLLHNAIENKGLNLVCDIPENVSFNFDHNMIATVVRNLISNAIKFNLRGGKIEVSVKEFPDLVSCFVKDTGIGIEEDNLKKLWGIDTYYSTRGTDGEGGTGLGLILCKDFIEKHGGKISVESEVDKGSTFSFTLPKNLIGNIE
ncbi:hypothetical protein C0389_10210 [bacterium]|nr:hypothetical protein [bacterium]